MAIVEVNQVQVTFGEKTAVSAASFSIEKGETFSLIGESGCGKSTLLRVLAGLQREWRGSIALLGEALTPGRRFEGELRRNVQMVFQDPWASLHPNHTISRTLSEPLNIRGETQTHTVLFSGDCQDVVEKAVHFSLAELVTALSDGHNG